MTGRFILIERSYCASVQAVPYFSSMARSLSRIRLAKLRRSPPRLKMPGMREAITV